MALQTEKSLATILKKLRLEENLTQRELAKLTGLSLSSIVSYENGLREPNSKAMAVLERFFGVSGDYLRGNIDKDVFFENSLKLQGDLDSTIKLITQFKDVLATSSQKNQSVAVFYLNYTLEFIIKDLLPDDCSDIEIETLCELISDYANLNKSGKQELLKRANELLQLKTYIS